MSLDDLRKQANSNEFIEEEPVKPEIESYHERPFLGLTSFQRFVIALLLFMIACMISSFILLVTQRMVLPFL